MSVQGNTLEQFASCNSHRGFITQMHWHLDSTLRQARDAWLNDSGMYFMT